MNIYENRACIAVRWPDIVLKTDRDNVPVLNDPVDDDVFSKLGWVSFYSVKIQPGLNYDDVKETNNSPRLYRLYNMTKTQHVRRRISKPQILNICFAIHDYRTKHSFPFLDTCE